MQSSQANTRSGYTVGEFLTRTYRISGEVASRGEPLLDRLNDHNALFCTLERIFISPLLDPAVHIARVRVPIAPLWDTTVTSL